MWGIAGSVFAYLGYLIYKDLRKDWPPIVVTQNTDVDDRQIFTIHRNSSVSDTTHPIVNAVVPQAAETVLPEDEHTEQNVTFMDAHPGFKTVTDSIIDPVRSAALNDDATLEHFFQRPLKIFSQDWITAQPNGGLLFERFNPWQLYFENPRVINRISNFKLMHAKLCVKFTINGNAFHYGRVICSYEPLASFDTMTVNRAFIDADVVAASQRPHVFLDPTNSQGGELCLPFFTPRNLLDITTMDWREMGEITMHSIQGLKHANGATDQVTINVFAWAEDVRLSIPTQVEPGAILPQAAEGGGDEYGKRPVSRIAGAVANYASYLVKAPVIGPFARATEIGASAIGTIATIFGYSSPACLDVSHYRPVTSANISCTNMPSDAQKMSVDAKQELSIDPRTVGLASQDELDINYIASHESWFTSFSWGIGAPTETLLFNVVVDPGVHTVFNDELHFPAPAFACMPFRYWRGTLRYRFQIVCSKFHKGRLKVVYDPSATALTAEYNTAYTAIVDISDTSDFSIDVGWGQRNPYRDHFLPTTAQGDMFLDSGPLSYSSNSGIGNGVLSVFVVNELTVPDSTINNDISVNVFVSALSDFEVASPESEYIGNLRITAPGSIPAPAAPEGGPPPPEDETPPVAPEVPTTSDPIEPQAQEGLTEEKLKVDSEPYHVSSEVTFGNQVPSTGDPTNLIYFGEKIKSMRQMLKRFSRHTLLPGIGAADTMGARSRTPAFPTYAGYVLDVPSSRRSFFTVSGTYFPGWFTFMNYVTCAYGGWRGGIRHMYDLSEYVGNDVSQNTSVLVRRNPFENTLFWVENLRINNTWRLDTAAGVLNSPEAIQSWDGGVVQAMNVNPFVSFEAPYQLPHRFSPAKRKSSPAIFDEFDTGIDMHFHGNFNSLSNRSYGYDYVAGAEDYTCFYYLGPPIFYIESSVPSV